MLISIGRREQKGDVIDLLLECHGRIRTFVTMARATGESQGREAHELVDACARVERYFTEALPLHVQDEEESLLPRLQGRRADVDRALASMHAQHEAHRPLLEAMLGAAGALRQSPGDPALLASLAGAARRLELDFQKHLDLEENLLFPAARELLEEAERADILGELRARRQRP